MPLARKDGNPDSGGRPSENTGEVSALERSRFELSVLRQLLAERGEKLEVAMQRINSLEAGNACLKRQLRVLSRREADALRRAHHDELTGLPNRSLLMDRLSQAVGHARRHGGAHVAILFLDLDGFKAVNDRFGHRVGDLLLKRVANRLKRCLRATDTACRFGGDEFVVMLPDITTVDAVMVVARKLQEQLAKPFRVNGQEIHLGASVGSAVYPYDGKTPGALIGHADGVMYSGKRSNGQSR